MAEGFSTGFNKPPKKKTSPESRRVTLEKPSEALLDIQNILKSVHEDVYGSTKTKFSAARRALGMHGLFLGETNASSVTKEARRSIDKSNVRAANAIGADIRDLPYQESEFEEKFSPLFEPQLASVQAKSEVHEKVLVQRANTVAKRISELLEGLQEQGVADVHKVLGTADSSYEEVQNHVERIKHLVSAPVNEKEPRVSQLRAELAALAEVLPTLQTSLKRHTAELRSTEKKQQQKTGGRSSVVADRLDRHAKKNSLLTELSQEYKLVSKQLKRLIRSAKVVDTSDMQRREGEKAFTLTQSLEEWGRVSDDAREQLKVLAAEGKAVQELLNELKNKKRKTAELNVRSLPQPLKERVDALLQDQDKNKPLSASKRRELKTVLNRAQTNQQRARLVYLAIQLNFKTLQPAQKNGAR